MSILLLAFYVHFFNSTASLSEKDYDRYPVSFFSLEINDHIELQLDKDLTFCFWKPMSVGFCYSEGSYSVSGDQLVLKEINPYEKKTAGHDLYEIGSCKVSDLDAYFKSPDTLILGRYTLIRVEK